MDDEVDVVPQVVVSPDVGLKAIAVFVQCLTGISADKADVLHISQATFLLISQLCEGGDNDRKKDVEHNGNDKDIVGKLKEVLVIPAALVVPFCLDEDVCNAACESQALRGVYVVPSGECAFPQTLTQRLAKGPDSSIVVHCRVDIETPQAVEVVPHCQQGQCPQQLIGV